MGPAFWQVDLALSKLIPLGTHRVELRFETFNLFDTFNWGNPEVRHNRGAFGRINSQAGDPRITLCDTRRAVSDELRPDRLISSPDGLHPSPEGYKRMALALEPAINQALMAPPR